MRYGLLARHAAGLELAGGGGCGPSARCTPATNWAYLYGAAKVGGQARVEFLYCPTVNLEHSQHFLEQLGAREPGATHVVIWDGAGFHPPPQDGAAGLPDNVRLLALPPYSPEREPH
jgi:putative transposase